jgi:leader peptidase (prepilin peptidase)/N-methyltransferase
LDPILAAALIVAGLVFGSFLNVCISRIPRDISIVSPRSFCPKCQTPIRWHDNIPVLSWILLRGRCRHCGRAISWRYPAVELLTALLFLACYASFGPGWIALKSCIFCFLTVGLIFMDAETGLLPAESTYPGIALGLFFAWVVPVDHAGTDFLMSALNWRAAVSGRALSLCDAVLAAVIGAGFFYVAWAAYYLVRKRHGLGFGDIAMIAMAGAFLGLKLTVLVVFLSPILATLYAALLLVTSRSDAVTPETNSASDNLPEAFLSREVPFGVFLGVSSLLALFLGQRIWSGYLGLFR